MSEPVLIALISSSAGLIGALAGFAASFLTTKQNVDMARQQRRFERAQEMQAEVVPQLIAKIKEYTDDTAADYAALSAIPLGHPGYARGYLTREEWDSFFASWLDTLKEGVDKRERAILLFMRLHDIWIPDALLVRISVYTAEYGACWGFRDHRGHIDLGKASQAVKAAAKKQRVALEQAKQRTFFTTPEGTEVLSIQAANKMLEAGAAVMVKPVTEWLKGEGEQQRRAIYRLARELLGVEQIVSEEDGAPMKGATFKGA